MIHPVDRLADPQLDDRLMRVDTTGFPVDDVILAVGRKTSTRIDRRPGWLYFDLGERSHVPAEQSCVLAIRYSG